MKTTKIFLVLLAAFFISANLYAQPGWGKGRGGAGMAENLNLTDAQKDKIESMRLQHHEKMIDLRADLQKKELSLREVKSKKNFTREQYLAAVETVTEARNKIAMERANFRMDVYAELDEDQKEIFNKMPPHKFRKGGQRFGYRGEGGPGFRERRLQRAERFLD